MKKPIKCKLCGAGTHYTYMCRLNKRRAIPKQSSREMEYQIWLRDEARPAVIHRQGLICACGGCKAKWTDLDHILNKGSHPELKRDINNLQGLCRVCHTAKTIRKTCQHGN